MEAMIFAAGLGTRLRPLTCDKPKALVELGNSTLLDINITKLISAGCHRIIINTHHFSGKIINHIKAKRYDAQILISDESPMLLDTGGGLLKARSLFSGQESIILHNVDIISDLDFSLFEQAHLTNPNTIATLAVSKRHTARQLLFRNDMQLGGWRNDSTGEQIITNQDNDLIPFGFSGIALVSPSIFDLLDGVDSFSIISQYLQISRRHCIIGFVHSSERWHDLGTLHNLSIVREHFLALRSTPYSN